MKRRGLIRKDTYCNGLDAIADYLGERLGCSITTRTISRWIRDRKLPVKKKGMWTVATHRALDEWIDSDL